MDSKYSAEMIQELTDAICFHQTNVKCLVGFDGYVDELYSVVSHRENPCEYSRYEKIEDFGNRIINAAGKSADIEIYPVKVKIGGNAPILANALAALDYKTVCIGQMDTDEDKNPFLLMNKNCNRISTGIANKTVALEFGDGKIMLGDLRGNYIGWQDIKEKVGQKCLRQMTEESRLIGIVNWGGMYKMNEILDGMITEMLLPCAEQDKNPKEVFIDLADPSARSEEDMTVLFHLIQSISSIGKVTLGMNENEAYKVGRRFAPMDDTMEETGERIREGLGLYQLVIHTNQKAYGFRQGSVEQFSGMYVENPIHTTGAGDHFNAGFCMGILENRSLYENLILGQAMASYYIAHGESANKQALAETIWKYVKIS